MKNPIQPLINKAFNSGWGMRFYKLSKILIFLIFGIVLACSPVTQQPINKLETKDAHASEINVYIDPDTGEFLSKPPEATTSKKKIDTTKNQKNIELGITPETQAELKEQQSSTPGGGTYIKIPAP